MDIANAIDVRNENVLCQTRLFVFHTERPRLDDVTVFHRGSSEKPGAQWGCRKSCYRGDAL